MKALSVRQPWAWLIVNGYKTVENRKWTTDYRGSLLIHASSTVEYDAIVRMDLQALSCKMQTGGIVGIVKLTDIVTAPRNLSPRERFWFEGPFGWILEAAKPVTFRPCKGALGLFDVKYRSSYATKGDQHG